jgi:hypothetical protein
MPSDLKKKLAVPPLMEKLPGCGPLYREPTEHERARGEAKVLVRFLALQTNAGNRLGPAKPLL